MPPVVGIPRAGLKGAEVEKLLGSATLLASATREESG
jgi:hypothetical protein